MNHLRNRGQRQFLRPRQQQFVNEFRRMRAHDVRSQKFGPCRIVHYLDEPFNFPRCHRLPGCAELKRRSFAGNAPFFGPLSG